MEATIQCPRCGETKAADAFYRNASRPNGRNAWCAVCIRSYYRKPPGDHGFPCPECGDPVPPHAIAGMTRTFCSAACRKTAWLRDNKRALKSRELERRYGITLDDFDALLGKQDGACAICDTTNPGGRGWHLDHDHDTGKVRGVLCSACNPGLGQFGDNATVLARAIAYLIEHKPTATAWWCDTPEGSVLDAVVTGGAR